MAKIILKNNKATSEGGGVPTQYALHGIPFTDDNAVLVRNGNKTETRRVKKPRYKVGDVLYVKEALRKENFFAEHPTTRIYHLTAYRCDDMPVGGGKCDFPWKWKRDILPAMFMPRKAARTFIEVLSIHKEHLHDITNSAARIEGVADRVTFRELWNSINTKPGFRWADNPLVWVTRFERCEL